MPRSHNTLTAREFAMYFLGLEENGSVTLSTLNEKLPYEEQEVVDSLEDLKAQGYIESAYEGCLKPVKTQGFDDHLYNIDQDTLVEEEYWLTNTGEEFIKELELDSIKDSLEYTLH